MIFDETKQKQNGVTQYKHNNNNDKFQKIKEYLKEKYGNKKKLKNITKYSTAIKMRQQITILCFLC